MRALLVCRLRLTVYSSLFNNIKARPNPPRPKSSYVPVQPNYSFTQNKNKRPLSSFNPKSYSSQSNAEPLPAAHSKPSSYTHDSSPSPDLDESIQGPGVIGAQELYNDPRDKMMKERESIKRFATVLSIRNSSKNCRVYFHLHLLGITRLCGRINQTLPA